VIVTLSNDSWLDGGAGARLHLLVLDISEHRDATSAGARHHDRDLGDRQSVGDVTQSTGIRQRAGLVGTITPVRDTPPPATRWRGWLGPMGLVVAAALLAEVATCG
jgi:apolipoprotein N-acyltransferase